MNRWFVVAQYSAWRLEENEAVRVPLSLLHAKQMGTMSTACGLPCDSWHRWWDRPFPPGDEGVCASCSDSAM